MNRYQIALKWILLLSGLFLILAFLAMFIPRATMASAHSALGLGEFPDTPITFYLTRSTSLLYGIHGVMMSYVAMTLRYHWRLVSVFGWLHIAIGTSMLLIDLFAPMPWYWTAAEGIPVAGLGVLILFLSKRAFSSKNENGINDETASVQ